MAEAENMAGSSVPPFKGKAIETKPLAGSRMKSRKAGSALSFST
jgi:hypothetical protein